MANDKDIKNITARVGADKELTTLNIMLAAKIGKSAITLEEYISLRVAQGASVEIIKKALLDDLTANGMLFKEFKNALKPTYTGSLNRFRDAGEISELGTDIKYNWVAVMQNTCFDCLFRHDMEAQTLGEWEMIGLPRTGATVCRQYCQCMLVPSEVIEEQAPIYRKKK